MKAVIMAGGKGTRMQSIASDIPKPMIKVHGKPVLEYQIESLKNSGVIDLILIIGHLGSVIKEYFGNGESFGVNISYITEEKPLGTAGAFYYLKDIVQEDFLLLFGDLMLDVDFHRFMNFHQEKQAEITLFGHPNSHPYDSDIILADVEGKVFEINSKNNDRSGYTYHNCVNAGIYCVSAELLDQITECKKTDMEKDLIARYVPKGMVFVYKSPEYVKDMGTPERFKSVEIDVSNGIVQNRSLRRRQKCIFLDRDGTINKYKGFLRSSSDFELLPGTAEAIKKINGSGYLAIVATNQPVIARGECSYQELDEIHKKMETDLGNEGAYIDDLYFCPHHPHKGYVGEIPELKIDCECRKPKTGMLMEASKKYNIDLKASWYIGDTTMDVQTGINAGMHTALVQTGEKGMDGKYSVNPELICKDLLDAIEKILLYQEVIEISGKQFS